MFQLSSDNINAFWGIVEDIVSRSQAVLAKKMVYDAEVPSIISSTGKAQDYVRYRAFELIAQELKENNIQGSMAEAGVCKGAFATIINYVFPERRLYLFDTFEGFSKEQITKDHSEGLISEWFTRDGVFADTSVDLVLQNMPYKENVVPVKGLFEDTSRAVEDVFAFVSLDMDLHDPMLSGLEYFYPRMAEGGYIFMHDYNHSAIKGVKLAVKEYEQKHKITLHKMPLPDEGGTLVIIK